MRANGELVCLGADDLRIQPEELAAIASLRGKPLSLETAQRIQERTQGWAAGVVLMLEHAKIAGRVAELPGEATPQAVFDYLAGEIFERFPPETRQFLLRIACLQRTTAEVAQALSGEAKAGRLLLNLAHNDYFVREVVGDPGRVFQLHPLLRDFLLSRAASDMPEAIGAPALRQAATLLRQAGQVEDAVALLIESRDWPALAALVAEMAHTMLAQGRRQTLAAWLELLPPELLDGQPQLLLALAASRLYASPRIARRRFEQAFAGFRAHADPEGMIRACRGVIDATVLEFDDLATLDPWIGELVALCRAHPAAAPTVAATLIRALLLRDPSHPDLADWLDRAGAAPAGAPNPPISPQRRLWPAPWQRSCGETSPRPRPSSAASRPPTPLPISASRWPPACTSCLTATMPRPARRRSGAPPWLNPRASTSTTPGWGRWPGHRPWVPATPREPAPPWPPSKPWICAAATAPLCTTCAACWPLRRGHRPGPPGGQERPAAGRRGRHPLVRAVCAPRSEEHTSELQSPLNLVCRLLLEKK